MSESVIHIWLKMTSDPIQYTGLVPRMRWGDLMSSRTSLRSGSVHRQSIITGQWSRDSPPNRPWQAVRASLTARLTNCLLSLHLAYASGIQTDSCKHGLHIGSVPAPRRLIGPALGHHDAEIAHFAKNPDWANLWYLVRFQPVCRMDSSNKHCV